jgi:glycosyltransferase involved in cell wall biosynthesis
MVEPGDLEAIADRLARLAADPDLRARMGAAGRERVLPRYAVERLIDDVDALYRLLLAQKGVVVTSAPARRPQTTVSAGRPPS